MPILPGVQSPVWLFSALASLDDFRLVEIAQDRAEQAIEDGLTGAITAVARTGEGFAATTTGGEDVPTAGTIRRTAVFSGASGPTRGYDGFRSRRRCPARPPPR